MTGRTRRAVALVGAALVGVVLATAGGVWAAPGFFPAPGSGGGGSSDHAALSNLDWAASGHSGTASKLLVTDGAGAAAYGSGSSTAPQFTTVEVGAASDTTLARASAGNLSVEGQTLYRAGGTDVALADGGTGASDAATARTNLGFGDSQVNPQYLVLGSDFNTSSTTVAVVTGFSFTPAANAVYAIEVFGLFTAAASTTGLTWNVATSGADGTGVFYGTARGASASAGAFLYSAFDGGGAVAGASSGAASASPFTGFAIVSTDASPTDIGVYAATEVAASQVTVKAGSVLRYRRLQ